MGRDHLVFIHFDNTIYKHEGYRFQRFSKLEGQTSTGNQGTEENVQIREGFQIGEVPNKRGFTVFSIHIIIYPVIN